MIKAKTAEDNERQLVETLELKRCTRTDVMQYVQKENN